LAIDDRGRIVGSSTTTSGQTHAFLWQRGKMTDLGTLGRAYVGSSAVAVNAAGQVIGTSFTAKVTQTGQQGHAFLWQRGTMRDLGTLGPAYPSSDAVAINGRGLVVGTSRAANGPPRPVLWRNRKISRLPTLGGGFTEVVAVGDRGQVVGSSVPAGRSVVHAFVWDAAGGIVDLGTLGGAESDAAAVNAGGSIVGVAATGGGRRHAVLWTRRARGG
jgi:probable HAF family extracellular repeat protein